MGTVYEGLQPSLNRKVAIKVFARRALGDDKAVERFETDAQAVALLNHPNIVQIMDKDQEDELVYVVMEYVEGSSLEEFLRHRRLTLQEAFTVFKKISLAIEHAHRKGIIHRDINPRNVLVSSDLSTIKVVDFGIRRVESTSEQQGTLSTMVSARGTLQYVAPEQAANILEADHRSDIYSLGVLLYFMLTGRVRIGSFDLPSRLNNEVPPEVDPIVMRCLATDPRDRYQTTDELVSDVRNLEGKLRFRLANELKGMGNIFRRSRQTIKRRWGALGAAVGVLMVVALAIVGWRASRDGGEEGDLDPAHLQEAVSPQPEAESDAEGAAPEGASYVSKQSDRPGVEPEPATPAPAPKPPAPAAIDEDLKVALDKLEAGLGEQALADIDAILEKFDEHPSLPEAYLLRGRIQMEIGRPEDAMGTYVEIGSRFQNPTVDAESRYRLAQLTLRTRKGSELVARAIYGELANDHPESSWAPLALVEKAAIERDNKIRETDSSLGTRVPAALTTYRTLVDRYPRNDSSGKAFWTLGDMYKDLKLYELAADAYTRLGENFPGTHLEAWWKVGQISEKRLKDKTRAKEAYQRVPEGSRRYKDAQQKAARMDRN